MSTTTKLKYAVIRCRNAGVHAGHIKSRKGGVLTLVNSRRLWRWSSTAALSSLAIEGPYTGSGADNRYEQTVPMLDLTDSDVCEVIYASKSAEKKIKEVPVWSPRK